MEINPTHAPRLTTGCRVCKEVASPGDVTIRLFDAQLNHLPLKGAVDYLRSVGMTGFERNIRAAAVQHRRHVDAFIAREGAIAPAQIAEGLSRVAPPMGPVGWVDVNQDVMSVGSAATALIAERLRSDPFEIPIKDLVSVMNAGSSAATMRASAEMKGQLRRAEALARLASGFKRPDPA